MLLVDDHEKFARRFSPNPVSSSVMVLRHIPFNGWISKRRAPGMVFKLMKAAQKMALQRRNQKMNLGVKSR
ncbi:hypothetical protein [Bradyrhizobium sp. WSM2793]|uniref:hypothetical protein n=1 Tax=Bradyrhizobium sp. WSM2793 TaxID=1038866 RepID=UPI00035FFAA0|nr:hypothetical protein [Bradyrhizobium sp. WSM2793]